MPSLKAADLYWDGGTVDIGTDGDGASAGGIGSWDTTLLNWDAGVSPHVAWNNANNDTAIFGGTAGTVTLLEDIAIGGITFNTAGYVIAGNTLTLASGTVIHSTVGTSNSNDPLITSALAGTNGFTKTGSGWLGLESTTSSLSGNIDIEGGTLYVRSEALGTANIVFTGDATLTKVYNASKDFTANITINSGVTATMNAASFYYDSFHAGILAGDNTSALNISLGGNSELEFRNNANTFAGQLSITGPGIDTTNAKAAEFNSLADSNQQIRLNNAIFRLRNGGVSMNFTNRQLVLNNQSGALDNDSTNASVTMSFSQNLLANVGNNNTRILRLGGVNTGDNTFSGIIANSANGTGTVGLEKWEAGKWILGNNNTYTGKTTVRTGTLEVGSLKNLDTASSIGMNNVLQLGYFSTAGTLRYVGAGDSTDRPIQINDYTGGTGNTASGIILNDGTGALTFTASEFIQTNEIVVANRSLELGGSYTGASNTIQGIIQDIAPVAGQARISVIKRNDASTWALTGNNAYTGNTTVSGGTLEIGGSGRLGQGNYAGNISVASTNSGMIRFNTTADQTLSGVISGAGAVVKNNTGSLILTNINTHTGSTTINGGVLAINGTGSINSSAVIINGGDFRYNSSTAFSNTLTFTSGSISGTNWSSSLDNLTIGANQTISPGNSPGTATTGSQEWAGGGSYLWEINNVTGAAGSDPGWDLLSGTGNLTISATDLNPFNILLTSLDIFNDAGDAANFSDAGNYSWMIADFNGEITTFSADAFALNTAGFTNDFTGTFDIVRGDASGIGGDNSQIWLTYTAIPEPHTALLGVLGALLLLRRKRS